MGLQMPDEGEISNGDLSYNKLIDHIDDGIVHIPDFQRKFVWNEQKIIDLLDSIYKSYPIGSLIFWVTQEDFAYSAPIGDNNSDTSLYRSRFFVIDGQQRLKSLYYAAKSKELEMESGTKSIDVLFDLENEEFTLRGNIRNRRKSSYPIPGVRTNRMVLDLLTAVSESDIERYQEESDLSNTQIEDFLFQLSQLGLIVSRSDEYETTEVGDTILATEDNERVVSRLVDQVKFVKETLEIINETPGITRSEAIPAFQAIYGGSTSTAYQQFGRRCKWLRALDTITKQDGGYYLNPTGEDILEQIRRTEKKIESRYVPLDRILVDSADIDYDYLSQFTPEKRNKINELRQVFNDYKFSIILVNKDDWEEVCDIFERINTQGQHLTVVDLMIAKTWSGEEFNLRDELATFKDEIGEDIPDITILQSISLNICGQCRRQDILALSSADVKGEWDGVIEALRKSLDFLKNTINLPTLNLLPYPPQLVPLSRFFYIMGNTEPSEAQKEKLVRWFWKSSVANRFDSAVESKLEDDGEGMEAIADDQPVDFQYSYIQRDADDIITRQYSLRNAFVKTLLCLFASQHPVNPVNNTRVSHSNFSRYKQSEMHHIFPKHYLRTQGETEEHIHSIANIMFLPANINNDSAFKNAPKEYLGQIDNSHLADALTTHLIPNLEESGLLENDFQRFLNYRARQILHKLEEVTGEEKVVTQERGLSPETPFTNEMHIRELIRQADAYIYWVDKYFTRRGLEFLIAEVDSESVSRIQILTGTAQTTHTLRNDFKKFKKEMGEAGVTVHMKVLDNETAHQIHDRWLVTENTAYNIPSINTIGRGQYAEITEAASRPPFTDWWEDGNDILNDWNTIQQQLNG